MWLINTCTVKNPSQAAMSTLVARGKALHKRLVVCGCVPQGDKKVPELQDLSLLGEHSCGLNTLPATLCWQPCLHHFSCVLPCMFSAIHVGVRILDMHLCWQG